MKKDKIFVAFCAFGVPVLSCCGLVFFAKPNLYFKMNGVDVLKVLLGVWATLLGFIVTAESILITMGGKEYIQAFRKSKHYGTVLFTYGITGFDLFAATVFSIFAVCLGWWNKICFYFLIFFILSTIILIFFCLLFFQLMISKST